MDNREGFARITRTVADNVAKDIREGRTQGGSATAAAIYALLQEYGRENVITEGVLSDACEAAEAGDLESAALTLDALAELLGA